MTVAEALRHAAARLRHAGIENPALDARLLLAHATGRDQSSLLADPSSPIDPAPFHALLARRAAREPLALITGRQGFWTLDLEVSPETLIPRPETETLVEAALAARPPGSVRRVLDLGTGTGCLLLAALAEYPGAWGLGIDRVPGAAALARRNAAANGLAARAAFACADWAAPIDARFDLVLGNPPYIPAADIPALMPEVARHEPASALDGGPDGLDAYRTLLRALPALLAPGGLAVLELGAGQAEAVLALAASSSPALRPSLRKDLSGIDRSVALQA